MEKTTQLRISVNVFDEGNFIETRSCQPFVMPTGERGVLYRGLAHRLEDGDRINIPDGIVPTDEHRCTTAANNKQRYAIVPGNQSGYLLGTGSVILREEAGTTLREAGASIMRVGTYLGPCWDDWTPDWYLRFQLDEGVSFRDIEVAVDSLRTKEPEFSASHPHETSMALRLQLLVMELVEARANVATLNAQNARLRLEKAEAQAAITDYSPEIVERLETERQSLVDALAHEQIARAEAEALAESARTLQLQSTAPKWLVSEVETVLRNLMPRLKLLRDSLEVIAIEYRARGPLYRALAELQAIETGWPPSWKKLQGLNNIWERHVSDGTTDCGRIYARPNAQDRSFDVLISEKRDQSRDLAWLKNNR